MPCLFAVFFNPLSKLSKPQMSQLEGGLRNRASQSRSLRSASGQEGCKAPAIIRQPKKITRQWPEFSPMEKCSILSYGRSHRVWRGPVRSTSAPCGSHKQRFPLLCTPAWRPGGKAGAKSPLCLSYGQVVPSGSPRCCQCSHILPMSTSPVAGLLLLD